MRILLYIAIGLLVSSCASVSIKSVPPGAEVGVIIPGEQRVQVVGKTPFDADLAELEEIINEGTVVIVVRKHGYLAQRFIMPDVPNSDLALHATLLPDLSRNFEEVNNVISDVLEGERMILQKRWKAAMKIADKILKQNRNIVSGHELKASIYFLTSRLKESRYSWIRVLELQPQNYNAKKMLVIVETRMGIRKKNGTKISGKKK